MKISIIMPAYNSEKEIKNSIESILNQTYTNFELIIINDGSNDNTGKIVKKYQEKDNRIKYYYIENSGSAIARNVGLKHVTGDYIGFVDSDDLIDQYMYEVLLNHATDNNVDIVGASYEKIEGTQVIPEKTYFQKGYYDKEKLINEIYPTLITPLDMLDKFPKNIWSKIFRRDLINNNNITFSPTLRMSQDVIFTIECMLHAESFYYLPDRKFYKYITHQDSRTNTYLLDSWTIMKKNFMETKRLVAQFPYETLEAQLPYAIVRNAMGSIKNEGMWTKKVSKKQQLKNIKKILNEDILYENMDLINLKSLSSTRKILFFLMKYNRTNIIYIFSKLFNLVK